jgi:hypothetical protein
MRKKFPFVINIVFHNNLLLFNEEELSNLHFLLYFFIKRPLKPFYSEIFYDMPSMLLIVCEHEIDIDNHSSSNVIKEHEGNTI